MINKRNVMMTLGIALLLLFFDLLATFLGILLSSSDLRFVLLLFQVGARCHHVYTVSIAPIIFCGLIHDKMNFEGASVASGSMLDC